VFDEARRAMVPNFAQSQPAARYREVAHDAK
jgi:hypothetical protein